MKVGIIGAGTVDTTLGEHFAAAGHEVLITNSRGPESLSQKLAQLSQPLKPVTFKELVEQAEVFLLALPWRNVWDLLSSNVEWRGRVIVDATNIILSISPDLEVDSLKGDSGSQIVARLAPSARVVKAFNTLPFKTMFAPTQRASDVSSSSLATISTPSRRCQI